MSMFYGLNDDVYLVDGDFNSAIYDLKEGRLYHVDNKLKNFIDRVTTYGCLELTDLEQDVLKKLLGSKVLIELEKQKKE